MDRKQYVRIYRSCFFFIAKLYFSLVPIYASIIRTGTLASQNVVTSLHEHLQS